MSSNSIVAMHSWLAQWFDEGVADVARRGRHWVDHHGVMEEAIEEALERGWHLVEIGDQVIVIRLQGAIGIIC